MSGYLLLRDNKQTGPYSKDELIAKGFKPYDLIWAEGKSAGWRYPSELPEFISYAPVVEEQPFDRFYKKTSSTTSTNKLVTELKPAFEKAVDEEIKKVEPAAPSPTPAKVISIPSKKVFVTLPGSSNGNSQATIVYAERKQEEKREEKPVLTNTAVVKEKTTEYNADIPVTESKQMATPSPAGTYTNYKQNNQFLSDHIDPVVKEEKLYMGPAKTTGTTRNIFIGAVAACLLLGGIIIGLLISGNKVSQEQRELSARIRQIQERENAKKELPPVLNTNTTPQTAENSADMNIIPVSSGNAEASATEKEAINTNKKPNRENEVINTVQKTDEISPKAKPVAGDNNDKNKNTAEKPEDTKPDIAAESARQNIYQLVSVEGSKFKTGVLGGISNLQLTVANNSLYPLDQVEVLINYMNVEKRIVKKQTLVITDVAAGEQKTIDVPKSSRGVYVSYSITKINSRALGLAHSGL